MALGTKSQIKRNFLDPVIRIFQKILPSSHLLLTDIIGNGHFFLGAEQMGEIIRIHLYVRGNIRHLNGIVQMVENIILNLSDQRIGSDILLFSSPGIFLIYKPGIKILGFPLKCLHLRHIINFFHLLYKAVSHGKRFLYTDPSPDSSP